MKTHITDTILMVRPVNFRMNEQTAVNNYFQETLEIENTKINQKAQDEFDAFVKKLREKDINVVVINDTKKPDTPDSIFPNNWISFHQDGTVTLYPMFAKNRRRERRLDILETLRNNDFNIGKLIDYTKFEKENIFLEGTGSMVLDRENKTAYCSLSERADKGLFMKFCNDFEYAPVVFTSYQSTKGKRLPIYHTNVMMCLGDDFVIICLNSIDDEAEKLNVINYLQRDGKEIIAISEEQLNQFAGNMLQVQGQDEKIYLVMSSLAYNSLDVSQITKINQHCLILHSDLNTIESLGGGSARCMMAEIFLPKN